MSVHFAIEENEGVLPICVYLSRFAVLPCCFDLTLTCTCGCDGTALFFSRAVAVLPCYRPDREEFHDGSSTPTL